MSQLMNADFLAKIPKTDLHLHLDGSVRIQTLIDLAREQNVHLPSYDAVELERLVFKDSYSSLEEYLVCFGLTNSVLRKASALERVAYELAIDQFSIGVLYFEVRFAPQLHAIPGELELEQVIEAIQNGCEKASLEWNTTRKEDTKPECGYGLICCAMRYFEPFFSPYYQQFWSFHKHEEKHVIYGLASRAMVNTCISLRDKGVPIVGIDIAGSEAGYPAVDHLEAYGQAHKHFIQKTVHAGEGYGAQSIFQAITDLHAERIGHGFHLFSLENFGNKEMSIQERQEFIDGLEEYIAHQRICIEVCLTSNLQTIPEMNGDLRNHPFKKMLEKRLSVTLCSDNCTVSHTNVLKELELAIKTFDLTPKQVKDIVVTGFKRSFMPQRYTSKRAYIRKVINYYESLEKMYGIV